jgi:hypothetical protein
MSSSSSSVSQNGAKPRLGPYQVEWLSSKGEVFTKMNRTQVAKAAVSVLVGVSMLAAGGSAFAATHHKAVGKDMKSMSWTLNSRLYGNIPNVTIRGVQAGGASWVVQGHVKVTNDHIWATGKSLIIPANGYLANGDPVPKAIGGTTAGVKSVAAEVIFANGTDVMTSAVPLNSKGDFSINMAIKTPAGEALPIVLIGPEVNGKLKAWFASSNFLKEYGLVNKWSWSMPAGKHGKDPKGGKKSGGWG